MDEALKARLIGGAVLVILVVLLVPELLSGRKPSSPEPDGATGGARGTRTYTIDLGSGAPATAEPAPSQPGPAQNERSAKAEPEPEAKPATKATSPVKTTAAEPAPAVTKSTPPEPSPATELTPAPAARGQWAVQVGAFGSAETARRLEKELDAAGFDAYESPVSRGGKTLHRVRVGHEAERSAADLLASRLKARGLPATVVANE